MRVGLVVDATCDVPRKLIDDNPIVVLPITVHIDEHTFVDVHDPVAAESYFQSEISKRGHGAQTASLDVDAISKLFLERLVIDYDAVFCLTVMSTRSPIWANATQASFAILGTYRGVRHAAGIDSPFLMRVIDTQSLFAGQGVSTAEAIRLLREGLTPAELRDRLMQLAEHTWTYVVPRDLRYLRARTRKRGDRSVSLLAATIGSALDVKPVLQGHRNDTRPVAKLRGFDAASEALFTHVARSVQHGLLAPFVCVSYGGDMKELHALPGYAALAAACAAGGVTLYSSPMSITGMVNLGIGAVSVGYAADEDPDAFGAAFR